jgi:predicted metal-dependent hydrolase
MKIYKQYLKHKEKARLIITKKVEYFSSLLGFTYNRIAIRNQKTRLGSCSSKGNLNFNWQIINLPEEFMDYIIIHELSHLSNQNHSRNFWDKVAEIDPDYKIKHKWIKKNASKYIKR